MRSLFRGGALIGAATALVLIPAGLAAAFSPSGYAALPGGGQGNPTVFVQTDNPAGNQVIVLAQHRDGRLSEEAAVSTGGLGGIAAGSAADHLASQGSLTYDAEHQLLFAVNAGSDTISVLSVQQRHVHLDEVLSSGGEFPNSIAVHGNLVYVVNSGGTGSVSGFRIFGHHVVPIPGSTRSLGLANTNPPFFLDAAGQVAFSPSDSELLVATKAASDSIDVFQVGPGGLLSTAPTVNADGTNVPFSFASTASGQLVVAEPGPSALHTFSFGPHGTLTSLSASVSDGQSALCWVTAADDFYYVANAGSGDLSAYSVAVDGTPSLLGTTGVAATTDAGSIDLTASANGEYLYAEAGIAGAVDEFHISSDGSLSPLGVVAGLGAGIEGIAAG
jgi:6-phosphogluconolactonase (cycloisomerase 2 family)